MLDEGTSVYRGLVGAARQMWADRPWGTLSIIVFAAFALTVLSSAWLCDDAYITFRVVDNAINGHGLVWNTGERVQVYTNPLMMLLMVAASFVTREVYFTSLAISLSASVAAVAILAFKVSRSRASTVVALLLLIFSWSFVAYSTSGLENCLTFLLTALFFWAYFDRGRMDSRRLLMLALLFSLAMVNRLDTALLLGPALVFAYTRSASIGYLRMAVTAIFGMLPFVVWSLFSLVYYGFLFPNTAYAKLSTDIPVSEYLVRGGWYYLLSLAQDPIVVMAIIMGSALILVASQAQTSVPLAGVFLYLIYLVYIGGDFMRGRYFTAPLFVVLLVFVSIDPERWRSLRLTDRRMALGVLALLLVQNVGMSAYGAVECNRFSPYGIYNDKAIYYPSSNLPLNVMNRQLERSPLALKGKELRANGPSPVVRATIGFTGYYAGPDVHIVDPLALGDALLARMPAVYDPEWHVGHVVRHIPDGYLETIRTGRNQIDDPGLTTYYDSLRLIVAGDLWTRERWETIWLINTGQLDHLIDRERYRFGVTSDLDLDSL